MAYATPSVSNRHAIIINAISVNFHERYDERLGPLPLLCADFLQGDLSSLCEKNCKMASRMKDTLIVKNEIRAGTR